MTNNFELCEILCPHDPPVAAFEADQQELRERYEEQQRRLSCPSCGEDPFID